MSSSNIHRFYFSYKRFNLSIRNSQVMPTGIGKNTEVGNWGMKMNING